MPATAPAEPSGGHPVTEPEVANPDEPDEPEPEPGPEEPSADAPDRNTIGIVFIHGIGSQKPGETLIAWSQPLLRLLTAWATTTYGVRPGNDPTTRASVDVGGRSRPIVVASVPEIGTHPAQTWVMTEAWWASRVSPPPVGAMLRWLAPGELIRLWTGIVSGIASEGSFFFRLVDTLFLPLFLLPATALVVLAFVALRLLRAIPWRPIQDLAARTSIRLFLVDWFGDVRVLLTDRVQGASIRARVAEAISDCRAAGCGTIVLVGHGGGAIVGYMTLADETYAELPVDELITHGQALGIAWRLGHADEYDMPDRNPDHLYRGDRLRGNLSRLPFRAGLRWHDFRATHDPAPAGGLATGPRVTTPELVNGASIRVFNRMSLRNDHESYWANDEEFVLPVARLIDLAPAGSRSRSRFFPESVVTERVVRRRQRVKLLQFAWVAVMLSAVVALPLAILDPLVPGDGSSIELAGSSAWAGVRTLVDDARPVLSSANLRLTVGPIDRALAAAVGIVGIVAAYWIVGRVMSGLWTAWDERERRIALQPIPRWRSTYPLALQLGLCAGAALWLLTFTASGDWLFVVPSAVAVLLARVLGAITGRGSIRRPVEQELEQADVLP